jgi:hypothetical protein
MIRWDARSWPEDLQHDVDSLRQGIDHLWTVQVTGHFQGQPSVPFVASNLARQLRSHQSLQGRSESAGSLVVPSSANLPQTPTCTQVSWLIGGRYRYVYGFDRRSPCIGRLR